MTDQDFPNNGASIDANHYHNELQGVSEMTSHDFPKIEAPVTNNEPHRLVAHVHEIATKRKCRVVFVTKAGKFSATYIPRRRHSGAVIFRNPHGEILRRRELIDWLATFKVTTAEIELGL